MSVRKLLRAMAVAGIIATTAAACVGGGNDKASGAGGIKGGPLKIGTLLPETGNLAYRGPALTAAVRLAVKDVNEAGGVDGQPVEMIEGDSGDTTTDLATPTVRRELAEKVNVIVGAAATAVTLRVIDTITAAGALQISPADTADELTTYPDRGLYFRTAPPDVLQARALSDLILADGGSRLGIVARNDSYGVGLAANAEKRFTDAGGIVVKKIIYAPENPRFTTSVAELKAARPDAITVIGFDESAAFIRALNAGGIGPATGMRTYGVDGNIGNALGRSLRPGALASMKGTVPLAKLSPEFTNRLLEIDPSLMEFAFAGESYDAVTIVALAAAEARSNRGVDIAEHMIDVTKGGTPCTSFKDCKAIIEAGGDPDYDGVSGKISFNTAGEPTEGSYGIEQYFPDRNLIDDRRTVFEMVKGR